MNIVSIRGASFDDAATSGRGEAFDRVCVSLPRFRTSVPVREIIAKRIIEAAKNGERDPARLYERALVPFGIGDMSMLVVSGVGPWELLFHHQRFVPAVSRHAKGHF